MDITSKEVLRKRFVGQSLLDPDYTISTPSAILDLAIVERNCERMLNAVEALGLEWRPHVKTHKVNRLSC